MNMKMMRIAVFGCLFLFASTASATSTDGTVNQGSWLYGYVKMLQVKHDGSFIFQLSDTIDGPLKNVCSTITFATVAAGLPSRKDALATMTAAFLAGRKTMTEYEKIGTVCYMKTVAVQAGY